MKLLDYIISLFLLAALLAGCSAAARLQSTYGNKYRFSYSLLSPIKDGTLLFRDENLIIQFRFDDVGIRFQAQNISPFDIRFAWNKASVGIGGVYSGVRTLGNFYDSTRTLIPTPLIPPLGVVRDVALPVQNVFFDGTRWREIDLLPTADYNSPALRDSILGWVGSTVELILPVEIGSEQRRYQFTFLVNSVKRMAWEDYRIPSWYPTQPTAPRIKPSSVEQITAAILVAGFLGFSAYMLTVKKSPPVQ